MKPSQQNLGCPSAKGKDAEFVGSTQTFGAICLKRILIGLPKKTHND